MKTIAVIGVGGVGGYFGGRMAFQAGKDPDRRYAVHFVARGRHLEAIRNRGLVLNTKEQEGMICRPDSVSDRIEDLPRPDLCLVCVKSYDLDEACVRLRAVVRPDTVVLPLLNGVDMDGRIRKIIGTAMVLPACVYVGTSIEKPGVVRQNGGEAKIIFGPDPEHAVAPMQPLFDLLEFSRINYLWTRDPQPAIWGKYIFIAAFGLATAASGKTLGEVDTDRGWRSQVRDVMEEIIGLARERGVRLPPDTVESTLAKARQFPPETKTSFQRDVESKKARNEGDLFGENILAMARETGRAVPATELLWKRIREKNAS